MKVFSFFVVLCEWISFVCWASVYKKLTLLKDKLLVFYLGLIAATELLNFLFSDKLDDFLNYTIRYFIIPMQFVFLLFFLLYSPHKKKNILMSVFILTYIFFFIVENVRLFVLPVNFDSLSYGIGNLLLIISLIIALMDIFNELNFTAVNQHSTFLIYAGLIIFYIGSFPYENFRNYFWSKPSYYNTAYFLHYLSQAFNCIMYLMFAYAVKWKTK
jgi:hypothetical protein